jgi:hypothetical protein
MRTVAHGRAFGDGGDEMGSRLRTCWFTFCLLLLLALLSWWYDRHQTIKWIGATNLVVEFVVTSEDSSEPIPKARIEIHSHGSSYDGGREPEDFELQTEDSGIKIRA